MLFQRSQERRFSASVSGVDTGNVVPDGLQGSAQAGVTAARLVKVGSAAFFVMLCVAVPLGLMFYMRGQAAASAARKVEAVLTATAVAVSLPPTATVVPTEVVLEDYRGVAPNGSPQAQAVAGVAASTAVKNEGRLCLVRKSYIYDSGSHIRVLACGNSVCDDVNGHKIPREYLACEGGYPGGVVVLPTETPTPVHTPTPVIKWRSYQKDCDPCPECPAVVPVVEAPGPVLASDQIEICWRVDGVRGIWVDGQGVAGHECQVFALPYEGHNEAVRYLEIKVLR